MIQKSLFKPAWWLTNPHLQTIWQTIFRRQPDVTTQRERVLLPDGDFLDLDWVGYDGAPIVLVLHGIAGNIEAPYAKGILRAIVDHNWCGAFMNFRGCSGEPNRLPRSYHSGETEDLQNVVLELKKRYPQRPIAVVGFSMGGNVLLKYLGETGAKNPLAGGVAVSVPFDLEKAANHINQGVYRLYQWWILRDLQKLLSQKFQKVKAPVDLGDLSSIKDFWDFDNRITAPLHGFADARDYYTKSSSRQYLKKIKIPTLILHSADDPFMTKDVIADVNDLSPQLTLELSDGGGHVGFVTGTPWNPKYWLEERIPEFLKEVFKKNER
jgi:predicted alpha/beta-fold hydrolase